MIIISQSLVLAPGEVLLGTPIFGWDSLVTAANVSATSEADGYPASNVASPVTYQMWRAEPGSPPADEYLTVTIDQVDEIDFLAVAVHNFGTAQIAVSVEGSTGGSPEWFELVQETIPANDDPIIFRFTPQSLTGIRLRMQPSQATEPAAPFVAVMYVGALLVAERGTHADHVPINLARQTRVESGMSETGQFLGRIVLSQSRKTSFALQHLRDEWVRQYMRPFLDEAVDHPFFFAWRPQALPNDVGFCFLTNDPQPSRDFDTGRVAIELQMTGIAI